MKTPYTLSAIVLGTLALSACSPEPATETTKAPKASDTAAVAAIAVSDPWCRPTPNGAKVAGCYVTLTAASDDVLTGISTDLASMPQVHEMKHEDGMMKMAHLQNGLPLPAGQKIELKPGSNHVMLMGLKQPLVEGQTAKLTLNFAKAAPVTVEAAIRTPPIVDSEE